MRPLLLMVCSLLLTGCLLLDIRPLGGPKQVRKSDLPKVKRVEGNPVRTFLRPDAIPAIDDPRFVAASAAHFMRDEELVLGLVQGGEARAYSLWHLDRHEVVNDQLGGLPVAATW